MGRAGEYSGAVLCCVVLCCAVQCSVVLCCAVLCCACCGVWLPMLLLPMLLLCLLPMLLWLLQQQQQLLLLLLACFCCFCCSHSALTYTVEISGQVVFVTLLIPNYADQVWGRLQLAYWGGHYTSAHLSPAPCERVQLPL